MRIGILNIRHAGFRRCLCTASSGFRQGLRRNGDSYNSTAATALCHTKKELVRDAGCDNPQQARLDIFQCIEPIAMPSGCILPRKICSRAALHFFLAFVLRLKRGRLVFMPAYRAPQKEAPPKNETGNCNQTVLPDGVRFRNCCVFFNIF